MNLTLVLLVSHQEFEAEHFWKGVFWQSKNQETGIYHQEANDPVEWMAEQVSDRLCTLGGIYSRRNLREADFFLI